MSAARMGAIDMRKLVGIEAMDMRRLETFVTRVRDVCRSPSSFKKSVEIDVGHVAWRAAQSKQEVRNSMTREHIATLIMNGVVDQKSCRFAAPMEAAIDGRFASIGVTFLDPVREEIWTNVALRAVVRDVAPRYLVVTVYPCPLEKTDSLPEVPTNVW